VSGSAAERTCIGADRLMGLNGRLEKREEITEGIHICLTDELFF